MPTFEETKKMLKEAHEWWINGGSRCDLCDIPEDDEEELHLE